MLEPVQSFTSLEAVQKRCACKHRISQVFWADLPFADNVGMSSPRELRRHLRLGLQEARQQLARAIEIARAADAFAGAGTDKFSDAEIETRMRAGQMLGELAERTTRAFDEIRVVHESAERNRQSPGLRRAAYVIERSTHGLTRTGYGRLAVLARARQRSQLLSELTPTHRLEIRYKPDRRDLGEVERDIESTLRELDRLLGLPVLSDS